MATKREMVMTLAEKMTIADAFRFVRHKEIDRGKKTRFCKHWTPVGDCDLCRSFKEGWEKGYKRGLRERQKVK